uniref:Nacetylatedalphalinked acidic dipeptidaselike protein putative n=1 Tax=Albugo laibachii Nc14 TaxID=890382 RepID=F0WWJ2_9STRA|nr:Nacetylatedalphalinked acidic dipeptidaselike protein putative [Albugo laibachii Nc14]|eukprot:CCA25815.1 Nacetylatedalphalinked acidic dipeptidaselike protein putative [Albugo laibachii Nc14]
MPRNGSEEERVGMLKSDSLFQTVRQGLKLHLGRPVQPVGSTDEDEHHPSERLLDHAPNLYIDSPRVGRLDHQLTPTELSHRKRIGFAALLGLLFSIVTCCLLLNFVEHSQSFSALPPTQLRVMSATSALGARETLEMYTSTSRHTGSPGDYEWAKYIRSKAIDFGIEDNFIKLEEFEILINEPETMSLHIALKAANLSHDFIASFKKKKTPRVPYAPFHMFAKNGSCSGRLLYAHFATSSDLEALEKKGIDITGSILLVRMGKISLPAKVHLAGKAGAAGILTYHDPIDNGLDRGKTYPEGPWLSADEASFGSVYIGSGDPSTPDGFSSNSVDRISAQEMFASNTFDYLPSIISMPISAVVARQLMQTMLIDHPRVPTTNTTEFHSPSFMPNCSQVFGAWTGSGLNLSSYKVGPGNWQVKLENRNKYSVKKVWNVLITLRGSREADRYVIVGSQRDSLYGGAVSPGSGNAVFLEVLRAMGDLLTNGWVPHRTVLLASFDGEQYGSVGTSEWIDLHSTHLGGRGVAYLSLKDVVRGNGALQCEAAASLHKSIFYKAINVAQPTNTLNTKGFFKSQPNVSMSTSDTLDSSILIPETNDTTDVIDETNESETILTTNVTMLNTTYKPEDLASASNTVYTSWLETTRKQNPSAVVPTIHLPGMLNPLSPFLARLGIPSISLRFDNEYYGTENSVQDTFYYMKNYVDPTFMLHRAAAQLYASLILSLSDSIFLQYDFVEVARHLRIGQAHVKRLFEQDNVITGSDSLRNAIRRLDSAIAQFETSAVNVVEEMRSMKEDMTNLVSGELVVDLKKVREINTRLLMTEKAFVLSSGLSKLPWLKHVLYGMSLQEDYEVGYFPGVTSELYGSSLIPLRRELVRLCQTIEQAADTLTTTVL